jgi:hypothetical protein
MKTAKTTKGIKFDCETCHVVYSGTACNGGPGESPYIVLDIHGKEWKWFAPFEDVLYIRPGTSAMVEAFGYEDQLHGARLRRVRLSVMDNDGEVTYYGMKP